MKKISRSFWLTLLLTVFMAVSAAAQTDKVKILEVLPAATAGTVTVDDANPAAGATVTLTVTPQDGEYYVTSADIHVEQVTSADDAQVRPRRTPGIPDLLTVSEGTVDLTGAGTYTFTMPANGNNVEVKVTFTPRVALDWSMFTVTPAGDPIEFTYNAQLQKPEVTSATLVLDKDYTVANPGVTTVADGTKQLTLTGIGHYKGTLTRDYKIIPFSLGNGTDPVTEVTLSGIAASYQYKRAQWTPVPTVTVDMIGKLVEGTDYEVTYDENENVATGGKVTITGKGNFKDGFVQTFAITPKSIADATVDPIADQIFTGSQITPTGLTVKDNSLEGANKDLVVTTDYTLSYGANLNVVDNGTVTLTGTGNFTGTKTVSFNINPKTVTPAMIADVADQIFTGRKIMPEPVINDADRPADLVKGTDFRYEYGDNRDVTDAAVVRIIGMNNYTGTAQKTFKILAKSVATGDVEIADIPDQTYTRAAITPVIVVRDNADANKEKLIEGTDYTVAWSNNVNAGTATVTITGKGNYDNTTTLSKTFTILPKDIANFDVTLSATSFDYNNVDQKPTVNSVVWTDNGPYTLATDDSEYTISWPDAKYWTVGTHNVTITGTGNYTGTKNVTYTIAPKSIAGYTIELDGTYNLEYNNQLKTPFLALKDGATLIADLTTKDPDGNNLISVEYKNNLNRGTATVIVTGISGYVNNISQDFTITPRNLSNVSFVGVPASEEYTSRQHKPQFTLSDTSIGIDVVKSTDYAVTYGPNVTVAEGGTITVKATDIATSNYTGEISQNFLITAKALTEDMVSITHAKFQLGSNDSKIAIYDNTDITPTITVRDDDAVVPVLTTAMGYATSGDLTKQDQGTYTITVTGNTNYTGSISKTWQIVPRSIANVTIADIADVVYNGSAHEPVLTVTESGISKTLVKDVDYTVAYENNVNVARDPNTDAVLKKGLVVITGMGNYSAETKATKLFQINPKDIHHNTVAVSGIVDKEYNGMFQEQEGLTLNDSEAGTTLRLHEDYEVAYTNNQEARTTPAFMTITGKGNYTGTNEDETFMIIASKLSERVRILDIANVTYNRHEQTPKPVLVDTRFPDKYLVENRDYRITGYEDNVNAGTAIVKVLGINNYQGDKESSFIIDKKNIGAFEVTLAEDPMYFKFDEMKTPAVSAIKDPRNYFDEVGENWEAYDFTATEIEADFAVVYTDNYEVGTATATLTAINPNYEGTVSKTFTIKHQSIAGYTIAIDPDHYVYNGKEIEPAVKLMDGTTEIPVKDSFGNVLYTVKYKDNLNVAYDAAGNVIDGANILVQGLFGYNEETHRTFTIDRRDIAAAYEAGEVKIADIANQVYTSRQITPAITVTDDATPAKTDLVEGTDYTVNYDVNVDVAAGGKVTINGIGNYIGTTTTAKTFVIEPKEITLDMMSIDPYYYVYDGVDHKNGPVVTVQDDENTNLDGHDATVAYAEHKLVEGRDFSVVRPAEAKVVGVYEISLATVDGANYVVPAAGVKTNFAIIQKSISLATITLQNEDQYIYTGSPVEAQFTVKDDKGNDLVKDQDFTVAYENNVNVSYDEAGNRKAGAVLILRGYGQNYSDSTFVRINFTILPKDIAAAAVADLGQHIYTSRQITPSTEAKVTDAAAAPSRTTLVEGSDYTVAYGTNVDVAAGGTVTLTGIGNYTGTKTGTTFTILPKAITVDMMSINPDEFVYDGKDHKDNPVVTVQDDENTNLDGHDATVAYAEHKLVEGRDFTVTRPAVAKDVNDYTISLATVAGANYYVPAEGVSRQFSIIQKSVSLATITLKNQDQYIYTGSPVEAQFDVKDEKGNDLVAGTDYTVEYEDNVNVSYDAAGNRTAGAVLIVRGHGQNYSDSTTVRILYEILPRDINTDEIVVDPIASIEFIGSPIDLTASQLIVHDTKNANVDPLERDRDYTVTYGDNENVGTCPVTLTGKGNYTGTKTGASFEITARPLIADNVTINAIDDQTYTRDAIEPEVVITDKLSGKTLVRGTDFTVAYAENVNAYDVPVVTITGIGNYKAGDAPTTTTFDILPKNIGEMVYTIEDPEYIFNGRVHTPKVTLTWPDLTPRTDTEVPRDQYIVDGDHQRAVGNHELNISARVFDKANYTGEFRQSFTIKPHDIADETDITFELQYTSTEYDGNDKTPTVKLVNKNYDGQEDYELNSNPNADLDYAVNYTDNNHAGTATVVISGKGGYTGVRTATFVINKRDINKVTVDAIADVEFNGQAQEPVIAVTDLGNAKSVTFGYDYSVVYTNNVNKGVANVQLVALDEGNYTGQTAANFATFNILPRTLTAAMVNVVPENLTYTGENQKPEVVVEDMMNGQNIIAATDYTVENAEQFATGNYTVKVTPTATGNYVVAAPATAIEKQWSIISKDAATFDIAIDETNNVFTGKAVEPVVTVTDGTTVLTKDTQYTVEYTNNVNAGVGVVTVKGVKEGGYEGTRTATFTIEPKDIADLSFTAADQVYSGSAFTPVPAADYVVDANTTWALVAGKDFSATYADNTNAGLATITVNGLGNYKGQNTCTFDIAKKSLSELTMSVTDMVYNGSAQEPGVYMIYNGIILVAGQDFTPSWENNINATDQAKAKVEAIATSNYSGSNEKRFTIAAKIINAGMVELSETRFAYNGLKQKPEVTVTDYERGVKLVENVDYTVTNEGATAVNNDPEHPYEVVVKGIGNYDGMPSKYWTIVNENAIKFQVAEVADVTFTGEAQCPEPVVKDKDGNLLTKNQHYSVEWKNNTNAGGAAVIIKGMAEIGYEGTVTKFFNILQKDVADLAVTGVPESTTYTGEPITPAVTVTYGMQTLDIDTDYAVVYEDNFNTGVAKVIVKGYGNYTGKKELTFTINPKGITAQMVSVQNEDLVYNGEAQLPQLNVVDGEFLLAEGTDYVINSVGGVNVGTYTVELQGKGNYTTAESIKRTYNITPLGIAQIDVENVAAPVAGEVLPTTIDAIYEGVDAISSISWSPAPVNGVAAPETEYTATIVLTSNYNYMFMRNTLVNINGEKASSVVDSMGRLIVSYTFAKTGELNSIELATVKANADDRWFDLQGKRIERPTQKGIYILNNEKVVVK